MNFGKILSMVGGGLLGGIPGAIGGATGGMGGALGGTGLGALLAHLLGGDQGQSGGNGQQPEAFHNGFVDMRPDTGETRYLGGGRFDMPGYEMFGDLIPLDTPATKINGIPTRVFREQRAKYYGGAPEDYGGRNVLGMLSGPRP